MKRTAVIVVVALALAQPTGPARADDGPDAVRLRRWHVGVQSGTSWRSRFDVFDRPDLPTGPTAAHGTGGGVAIGRRFGDRFLTQIQIAWAGRDVGGTEDRLDDIEALLTGTVLFRPTATVQPFLRGGIGGGGQVLEVTADGGQVVSFGTAAVGGGGAQVRLGGRVSLECEFVGTVTNFLQVNDETNGKLWGGEDWQVRVSNWGWRAGAGVVFWF